METSGVGPKPSKLLARLIFWTLLAIFGVLALENLGLEFTTVPLGGFLAYLPRLLGTVLILCLGAILAVMAGTAIQASLVAISFKYHRSLASGAKVLILTVVVLAAIENLGFDISFLQSTLTNLITIFAAGLTVMFVLGGKVTAGNLLAGYYAREQFRVGDWIQLEAGQGELKAIGAVASEIVTSDGDLVVPNRLLVEGTVLRRAASSAGIDPPQA